MYNMRDNCYLILDKNGKIVSDSIVDDIDIDEYIDKSELNESAFNELSPTLTEKMMEPVFIKRREIINYLDENIEFKRTERSFDFWRLNNKVKNSLRETSSAFYTLIGIGCVVAKVYGIYYNLFEGNPIKASNIGAMDLTTC